MLQNNEILILHDSQKLYIIKDEGFNMAADDIKIRSLDDLRDAQAGAAGQGGSIPNYSDWDNILKDFEEQGIKSTGSYEGDLALRNSMMTSVMDTFEEYQKITEREANKQTDIKVGATENVTKLTDSDSDQNLKATFANATSSTIAADYMKYFHQL